MQESKIDLEIVADRDGLVVDISVILKCLSGIVGLIKPDMIKPGACVIDVGITRITTPEGKNKLVGDVDFEGKPKCR